MEKPLFTISCTTCQARLTVRDEAVIGAILACPKCESMVQVVPPPGWRPAGRSPDGPPETDQNEAEHAPPAEGESPAKEPPPGDDPNPAAGPPPPAVDWSAKAAASDASAPPVDPALADTVDDFPGLKRPTSERSEKARAASRVAPPPLPPLPPRGASAGEIALGEELGGPVTAGSPTAPPPGWTSPAEAMWRKWLILATAPVAGLIVAVGVVSLVLSNRNPAPGPEPAAEAPPDPSREEGSAPRPETNPFPVQLDRRWIPNQTRMLLSLRLARLDRQPEFDRLVELLDPAWREGVRRVMDHLGLTRKAVHRIYWSSTDLADWAENSVVVIELQEDQDAGVYEGRGEPIDLELDGVHCRRRPAAAWPHPFAVINERLVVTGREDLLRELAERSEAHLDSGPMVQMLQGTSPDVDAALMVDLEVARAAGWRLPTALLDVWPAGRGPWHVAWQVPQGVAVAVRLDDGVHTELALVCQSETAAEKVQSAIDELLPAGQTALAARVESLAGKLRAGTIKADVANRYETLLGQAQAGLKAARCDLVEMAVWMRIDWQRSPSDLARAALASRPAIRSDWLAAARVVDQQNHRRLLAGLGGYQRAEGRFPPGAVGGPLWKPDTRLSWIAMMLPYFDQRERHRQLDFGYSWNSKQNSEVTRQPLEAVVNPALGPGTTEAGFPVTHYVGVAGVGEGAGSLPAGDPRAGVFGFKRTMRPEDIADGAGNTIAILGVDRRLGPWGQGGHPTVRALTRPPYVHGPDGFGSGQPDGMLAGMADGSVRFISKDVDPRVLELLATTRGGEDASVAMLGPRSVIGPQPKPPGPGPGPAKPEEKPPPSKPAPKPPDGPDKVDVEVVKVDVKARLADKVAGVNFPGVPLIEVIEFLESYSTLRITLDVETMEQSGVTPDDPITLRLSEATVGQVLEAALARRGLVYVVQDNQVLVTRPPKQREALREVRYGVSDLAGDDPDGTDALAALVVALVAPETWKPAGGQGTIEATDDDLVVLQTDGVHYQVLAFCEKLRSARGKPLRSRLDPQLFKLDSRLDRARARLARPVTANFIEPAPLGEIISHLEQIGETTIVVDWIALAAAGVSPQVKGTLKADKRPLSEALGRLLKPMQLACRIVGVDTLQITTRKALGSRLDLEFYPAGKLLVEGRTPEALVEQIKGQVGGGTWDDAGGPGVLHLDAPSRCLIVLQSQPVQFELEALLRLWLSERKDAAKD